MDNGNGRNLRPCLRVLKKLIHDHFDWPFSKLEIFSMILFMILGLSHCIIFNSFLDDDIVKRDTKRNPIFNTLSILSPFLGLYGSLTFKLKQGFKINLAILIFLISTPLIVLSSLIGAKLYYDEIGQIVACIYILSSTIGFFLLKLIRIRMQKSFGIKAGDFLMIFLVIDCNLMFILTVSVLFLKEGIFSKPHIVIKYIGGTWLVLLGIIWLVVHSFVFKRYPNEIQALRSEILLMRSPSMQVQVILSENPGVLNVNNESFLLRNGHWLASIGILVSLICVEIGLIVIIAEYNVGEYEKEAFYLALFYSVVAPMFMFGGMVFSSAKLVTRDKYLFIIMIGALVPTLLIEWLSYYLYFLDSTFYLALVIGIGFPTSLVYWLSMAMIFQHNKRAYQYFSSILCLAILIPIGMILPLYAAGGMEGQTFQITEGILLSAGLILLIIWCIQLFIRLSKALCLLFKELRSFSSEDLSLYIYSLTFLLGYSLIGWMIFQQIYSPDDWKQGLIAGCFVILALTISNSLFLHRINLFSSDPDSPDQNFIDLIRGDSQELTHGQAQKKILKKKSLMGLGVLGISVTLLISIPVLASSKSGALVSSGVTVMIGGVTSTVIFLTMVELKHFLKRFGQKVISYMLGYCWLFCFVPLVVLIPVSLSSNDRGRMVTTWSVRLILLLLMVGVCIISITCNYLFNMLEYEKIAKFCCLQVQEMLDELGVKASLEDLRGIYDNLHNSSAEAVEKVLLAQTVYSFRELSDNDGDWEFSKELLTVKKLNKIRHKGLEIKKNEEKKNFSLKDFCKKICKKEENDESQPDIQEVPQDDDKDLDLEDPEEVKVEEVALQDPENDDWLQVFKAEVAREQEELERQEELKEQQRQRERERIIKLREDDFLLKIAEFKARLGFEKVDKICLDHAPVLRLDRQKKAFLKNSEELDVILNNIDARKMWIKTVFEIFSTQIDDDDQRCMDLTNFKNFIKFSGLEQLLDSFSSDNLFKRLTKRKIFVNFDDFYFRLLPRIRKMAKRNKKELKTEDDLFIEQLFPHLVNNIPALKTIISEFKVILDEYQEEIVKFSPQQVERDLMATAEVVRNDNLMKLETLMIEDKNVACSKFLENFSKCTSGCFKAVFNCFGRMVEKCLASLKTVPKPKRIPKPKREDKPKISSIYERPESPPWEDVCKMIISQLATTQEEAQDGGKEKKIYLTFNSANIMAIFGHILEIFSFSSIGFNKAVRWNFEDWFFELNDFILVGNTYWYEKFWICFGCSIIFIALLIPALNLIKKGRLGLNEDFTVSKFPSLNFFLSKFILLLGSTMYLTIMCAMLSVYSCGYNKGNWMLASSSEEIECFSNLHIPCLVMSIFTLILYYPAATLLYPSIAYQDRALDLKYDTSYLVLESQGKVLVAAFAVLFEKKIYIVLQLIVTIIVCVFLFFTCLKLRPCLVKSYNFWKAGGFLFPIWVCTCALINVCTSMIYVFEKIFIPGVVIIFVVLVVVYWKIYGCCQFKKKRNKLKKKGSQDVLAKDISEISDRAKNVSDIDNDEMNGKD